MLANLTEQLISLVSQTGAWGVMIATIIESFFPPIPSEIILFTAGLAAKEQNSIALLFVFSVAAAIGNLLGTLPFYAIAYAGRAKLDRFLDKFGYLLLISAQDLEKMERFFYAKGDMIVIIARLLPAGRSLIAFPAGLAKMSLVKYTIYTLIGSFGWNIVLSGLGFFAYDLKDEVLDLLAPFEKIVLILIALLIVGYIFLVIRNIWRLRQAQ